MAVYFVENFVRKYMTFLFSKKTCGYTRLFQWDTSTRLFSAWNLQESAHIIMHKYYRAVFQNQKILVLFILVYYSNRSSYQYICAQSWKKRVVPSSLKWINYYNGRVNLKARIILKVQAPVLSTNGIQIDFGRDLCDAFHTRLSANWFSNRFCICCLKWLENYKIEKHTADAKSNFCYGGKKKEKNVSFPRREARRFRSASVRWKYGEKY